MRPSTVQLFPQWFRNLNPGYQRHLQAGWDRLAANSSLVVSVNVPSSKVFVTLKEVRGLWLAYDCGYSLQVQLSREGKQHAFGGVSRRCMELLLSQATPAGQPSAEALRLLESPSGARTHVFGR
jgi:hypothetical protein